MRMSVSAAGVHSTKLRETYAVHSDCWLAKKRSERRERSDLRMSVSAARVRSTKLRGTYAVAAVYNLRTAKVARKERTWKIISFREFVSSF